MKRSEHSDFRTLTSVLRVTHLYFKLLAHAKSTKIIDDQIHFSILEALNNIKALTYCAQMR